MSANGGGGQKNWILFILKGKKYRIKKYVFLFRIYFSKQNIEKKNIYWYDIDVEMFMKKTVFCLLLSSTLVILQPFLHTTF